ncbi:MAG: outer membrane lipoprotein-sorting protein [Candidatus Sulfotelmatobacter sp.]
MRTRFQPRAEIGLAVFLWSLLCVHAVAQSGPSDRSASSIDRASMPLDRIVKNLQERNAQRAAALVEFVGTRVYRMQYHGFPGDRDAEMVVNVTYHSPNAKQFTIVSQKGSQFVIDHVFKKLLEGEQEAANEENRRRTALSTDNYDFSLAGYETSSDGSRYILDLLPKSKNKFLYRGKIWVDAKDFAVVRIEGAPEKNPSFWIKKTEVAHKYVKVNDFWLPAENHTESVLRIGGRAVLTIEYRDYKIVKSTPLPEAENGHDAMKSSQISNVR